MDIGTDNPSESLATQPVVWALASHRAGETSQILALAEGLGWPFQLKRVAYRRLIPFFLLGASRLGLDRDGSDPLEPPWPDLIISAGARSEPIARWIQRRSGKPVRLVHIGRTWDAVRHFDLVITTPQYRLPERPNILHNTTTLHRVTSSRLKTAARDWATRLDSLRQPYIAVIVGGNSGPYSFDCKEAVRLARRVNELAHRHGASLLVSTSARTPRRPAQELEKTLAVPYHLYHWDPDTAANPYYAYLALADELVVTGDSIAMLTEACATGKPVYIADLGTGHFAMHSSAHPEPAGPEPTTHCPDTDWLRRSLYRFSMQLGPDRASRDIRLVHRLLVQSGRATWLGEDFPPDPPPPLEDMDRAVGRVRSLFNLPGRDHASRLGGAERASN